MIRRECHYCDEMVKTWSLPDDHPLKSETGQATMGICSGCGRSGYIIIGVATEKRGGCLKQQ